MNLARILRIFKLFLYYERYLYGVLAKMLRGEKFAKFTLGKAPTCVKAMLEA